MRLVTPVLFALFAVACGGSTSSPTDTTSPGGPSGGNAGATGGAGTGGSAGSNAAGTAGSSAGGAATGGAAGSATGGSAGSATGGAAGAGGSANACFGTDGSVPSIPFKLCTNSSECVVAKHATDCCGSILEVGIAASEQADFAACEATWDMHFPPCGCESSLDQAEDGKMVMPGDTVGVVCTDFAGNGGICKTFVQSGAGGSGGSGSGGAGGCQGTIDVAVDNGPLEHWTSICAGSWGNGTSTTAVGYEFSGGPAPGVMRLVIDGCTSSAPGAEGVTLSAENAAAVGSYGSGLASYVDGSGATWGVSGDPFLLHVTKLDPVGGVIEGTFQVSTTHGGNAAHLLEGAFHVCRVMDELAP